MSALAARVGDSTNHPGVLVGTGVPSVLICGMPAAVVGTTHACAFAGVPPHPPSAVTSGSTSIRIGPGAAARFGDPVGCGATITTGAPTVELGG
jgi:uncharacterized Zn-binding protein involved in type VI secretion